MGVNGKMVVRRRSTSRLAGEPEPTAVPEPDQPGQGALQCRRGVAVSLVVVACVLGAAVLARHRPTGARKTCRMANDAALQHLAGAHHSPHAIATSSPTAQQLFDLGMLQLAGFNQLEAAHFFQVF